MFWEIMHSLEEYRSMPLPVLLLIVFPVMMVPFVVGAYIPWEGWESLMGLPERVMFYVFRMVIALWNLVISRFLMVTLLLYCRLIPVVSYAPMREYPAPSRIVLFLSI
jgi:hypothetical protein